MRRRPLGSSGLDVPVLILGGMFRDFATRQKEIERTIDCALDHGVDTIDCAPLYGFGESESLLGRLFANGNRRSARILTKVGLRWDADWGDILFRSNLGGAERMVRRDSRPESVRRDVDQSLQRLRRDRLDLVQIHQPDPHTPIEDTLGELVRLQEAGKLRSIGVSNFDAEQILAARAALGPIPLASTQNALSLIERPPAYRELPATDRCKLGWIAHSTLSRGLLGGRTLGKGLAFGDKRNQRPLFQPKNVALINAALEQTLRPIADRYRGDLAAISIAWVLAQPDISGAITGAQSEEQLRGAIRAAEVDLDPVEVAQLDETFRALPLDRHAGISAVHRLRRKFRNIARRLGI